MQRNKIPLLPSVIPADEALALSECLSVIAHLTSDETSEGVHRTRGTIAIKWFAGGIVLEAREPEEQLVMRVMGMTLPHAFYVLDQCLQDNMRWEHDPYARVVKTRREASGETSRKRKKKG